MRVEIGDRRAMNDGIFAFGIFLKVKERTKNIELKEKKIRKRERIERGSVLEAYQLSS